MTSRSLHSELVSVGQYDILGQDENGNCFVTHAAMVAVHCECSAKHSVEVVDMAPPLSSGSDRKIIPSSLGTAVLTDGEIHKIRTFIDQHLNEHLMFRELQSRALLRRVPDMYCIHPHCGPVIESNGRQLRTRFSCAGFVFEAYRAARIRLVELVEMPESDLNTIREAYPRHMNLVDGNLISKEALGLHGDGPWQIMLPGYLLHAMNRTPAEIRESSFSPSVHHAFFGEA